MYQNTQQTRRQDGFRTLLQYQEVACFNENCAALGTLEAPLMGCSRCKRVKLAGLALVSRNQADWLRLDIVASHAKPWIFPCTNHFVKPFLLCAKTHRHP